VRAAKVAAGTAGRAGWPRLLQEICPLVCDSNDTHRENAPHPAFGHPLPSAIKLPRGEGTRWDGLARRHNRAPSPLVRGEGAQRADEGLSSPQQWRQRHSKLRMSANTWGRLTPAPRKLRLPKDSVMIAYFFLDAFLAPPAFFAAAFFFAAISAHHLSCLYGTSRSRFLA